MRLLYLVHDLDDAAVKRRLRFLREGGAQISLIGFRRHRGTTTWEAAEGLIIGQTENGRMLRRMVSTARAIITSHRWHHELRHADVVVSRSLEMLLLAMVVRRRIGNTVPIVYECLDIHRLMLRSDLVGRLLRRIERRLLDSSSLLIVSSPRFIDAYFARVHPRLPQWHLLENKLLASELPADQAIAALPPTVSASAPWRIGWFGIIRCRRSLKLLAALVRASKGHIEVDIRGRPAYDILPDFDSCIAATPGLTFGGSYDRAADLAAIYGRVHFNWAIDFYEDGLNSAWLLPNRLYEGSVFGTVPLALRTVETGQWLARLGCGFLLDQPLEQSLTALFEGMTWPAYSKAQQHVSSLDRSALLETADTAAAFTAILSELGGRTRAISATSSDARDP